MDLYTIYKFLTLLPRSTRWSPKERPIRCGNGLINLTDTFLRKALFKGMCTKIGLSRCLVILSVLTIFHVISWFSNLHQMLSRFQLTDICQSILCNHKLCNEVAFISLKVIQFLVIVSTYVHHDSHNREACLETVKKKKIMFGLQ